jgi:hypothetical protein
MIESRTNVKKKSYFYVFYEIFLDIARYKNHQS